MGWRDLARAATEWAETRAAPAVEDLARRVRPPDDDREPAPTGEPAELELTVSGGERGSVRLTLPCVRESEDGWLHVVLTAPSPVPLGTTTLSSLSLAVPGYAGPGRYDLTATDWEPLDLHLRPTTAEDESTWYADLRARPPATVEVTADGLAFDVPMASAHSAVRVTGRATYSSSDSTRNVEE